MKYFTVIGGVNGAGKSSLAGVLARVTDNFGTLVDADKLTVQCGGNRLEGGKRAVSILENRMRCGADFTWETTLSGKKALCTVLRARENGYLIRLYYVALGSAEESLRRIANRVQKGGHDIPGDTVRRRFAKRFDDLERILPHVDEALFFDNENGFIHVAEYRGEKLSFTG